MNYIVELNGQKHKVRLPERLNDGQTFRLAIDGQEHQATWLRQPGLLVLTDGQGVERLLRVRSRSASRFEGDIDTQVAAEVLTGHTVRYVRATVRPDIPGQDSRAKASASREQVIRSQITGKVLKVLVRAGEQVESGQALLIIEAMKMENRVFSQAAGKVSSVSVKDGDAVQTGKELLRLSP